MEQSTSTRHWHLLNLVPVCVLLASTQLSGVGRHPCSHHLAERETKAQREWATLPGLKSPVSGDRHQNPYSVRHCAKYCTLEKRTSPCLHLSRGTHAEERKFWYIVNSPSEFLQSYLFHPQEIMMLSCHLHKRLFDHFSPCQLTYDHNKTRCSHVPWEPLLGNEVEILLRDLKQEMTIFSRGLKQYLVIFSTLDLLTMTPLSFKKKKTDGDSLPEATSSGTVEFYCSWLTLLANPIKLHLQIQPPKCLQVLHAIPGRISAPYSLSGKFGLLSCKECGPPASSGYWLWGFNPEVMLFSGQHPATHWWGNWTMPKLFFCNTRPL